MSSENDLEFNELLNCFSLSDPKEIAICFHRLHCRDYLKEKQLTQDQKIAICQEISEISLENPITSMSRGDQPPKLWKLKNIPEYEFSGIQMFAWLIEIFGDIFPDYKSRIGNYESSKTRNQSFITNLSQSPED